VNTLTNITKYKFIATVYDAVIGNRIFRKARSRAFALLQLQSCQNVLLVGVGTGEDILLLPEDINIVGVDISEAMLEKAREKAMGRPKVLLNMNAEKMELDDETIDAVVLNLILSVVENPQRAMSEAVRVLKENGRILVFDKFLADGEKPSLARKLLNMVTSLIGTDINRRFGEIIKGLPVQIVHDEPSIFAGSYRIILLQKKLK